MRLTVIALSLFCSSILVTSAVAAQPLSLPSFTGVGLNGSGEVRIRHGASQQVVIRRGDASISEITVERGGSLQIRTCRTFCPSGYRLEVDIVTPRIGDLAVSGSGAMIVGPGFAPTASRSIAINGSGMIDASALSASQADVAVSGSGRVRAGAMRRLQAAISGSGKIGYAGRPEVQSAISGSGWVGPER